MSMQGTIRQTVQHRGMQQHLACTSYLVGMTGGYDCCNAHTVGQGTQTEEAGESIDAEDEEYEEDAAIEDVVEKNLLNLRILKMNWKNFDDK